MKRKQKRNLKDLGAKVRFVIVRRLDEDGEPIRRDFVVKGGLLKGEDFYFDVRRYSNSPDQWQSNPYTYLRTATATAKAMNAQGVHRCPSCKGPRPNDHPDCPGCHIDPPTTPREHYRGMDRELLGYQNGEPIYHYLESGSVEGKEAKIVIKDGVRYLRGIRIVEDDEDIWNRPPRRD
jgi:hypothetical protein